MPQLTTIDQAMQIAMGHHQAGRLQEAEQLYRQILAQMPEHVAALHLCGVIAHQLGRNEIAIDLIRRAIALKPDYAEAHNNLGNALKANGRLDEAIAAYRAGIGVRPNYAEGYSNLGTALKENGRFDEAIFAYQRAVACKPNLAEAHYNLGVALADLGKHDEAVAAYRQAIRLRANYVDAHINLGAALKETGRLDDAIACYQQAIRLNPRHAEAHNNLGNALKENGQLDEAIVSYRQAIICRPNMAEAHYHLGIALGSKGQLDDAICAYRRAIAHGHNYAEPHCNLGTALRDKGLFDEAIVEYRRAIALQPGLSEAHFNLGVVLKESGQYDEAIAAYREAIRLNPGHTTALSNLGSLLKDEGQLDAAIACYRRAVAVDPSCSQAYSTLVYTLQFHADYDTPAITKEQRRWNDQYAKPLQKVLQPHRNDLESNRRLRIGYVSPDFREHVVGRNVLPLIRHRTREQFEVLCYSNVQRPDALTTQFSSVADGWRSISELSDEQAVDLIRNDRIDILVDLTLHMAHNRLLIFAHKPAPVQVTFAGYPGSTGLDVIDYRLTDPYLDPPGQSDEFYSEQSIRLPDSFWCYDPASMMAGIQPVPQPGPLPALTTGAVTFGCLNNFCKVNEPVLALWARVLKVVSGSRMIVMTPQCSARHRTLDFLKRQGIEAARIEFVANAPVDQYFRRYGRIDIGLDTFPYNGHTTSLDALWMGVPVVTLVGQTVVGRAGLSQLSNLGLTDLVAHTADQYVEIVVRLASDLPKLAELRSTLRERMLQSPLTDAVGFTRSIESAYRQMWRRWCEGGGTVKGN